MSVLLWILLGAAVGLLGGLLPPARRGIGSFGVLMALGVLGALLGGFAGRALGFYATLGRPGAFVAAGAGALVLLAVYYAVFAGRRLY